MPKELLRLDELEVSLALHALRFYKNAKGYEVSQNTINLENKFDDYLSDTGFVVSEVESAASLLAAQSGAKGGASTSDAKKAASAANGVKGGRPRKPNLFIRFHPSVWEEPDPKLQKKLSLLVGDYSWLPPQPEKIKGGPFVRLYLPEIDEELTNLLGHSMNVWEWDDKPFLRLCENHKMDHCREITVNEKKGSGSCSYCPQEAQWIAV